MPDDLDTFRPLELDGTAAVEKMAIARITPQVWYDASFPTSRTSDDHNQHAQAFIIIDTQITCVSCDPSLAHAAGQQHTSCPLTTRDLPDSSGTSLKCRSHKNELTGILTGKPKIRHGWVYLSRYLARLARHLLRHILYSYHTYVGRTP